MADQGTLLGKGKATCRQRTCVSPSLAFLRTSPEDLSILSACPPLFSSPERGVARGGRGVARGGQVTVSNISLRMKTKAFQFMVLHLFVVTVHMVLHLLAVIVHVVLHLLVVIVHVVLHLLVVIVRMVLHLLVLILHMVLHLLDVIVHMRMRAC